MTEPEMTSEVVDLIHTLCGLCQKRNQLMYKQLKINEREFDFFMHVSEFNGLSIKEIAALIDVSQSNVSRLVDKLVARGLIERIHQDTDHRIATVSYSIRGKTKYDYAFENKCIGNEAIKSILEESNYQQFKDLLQEIVENYEI
ncbi:MAG TPA: hypothetical protein DDX98_09505 [Bacteroidales bacterium]|jgi:DNA-binding MarR family transcriptional regulator|nr:hypothetical protein [Bacteroidales bacterium]